MREGTVDVPSFSADRLLPFNYIDACALLRKEVWSACGGYDGAMPSPGWEDWDLWLGAIERGWEFHHHPVEAFDYRIAPQSMSAAIRESEETRRDLYAYVINKHRGLYQRRLPDVLLASQASARDLFNLARAHELLGASHARLEAGAAPVDRGQERRDRGACRADLHAEHAHRRDVRSLGGNATRGNGGNAIRTASDRREGFAATRARSEDRGPEQTHSIHGRDAGVAVARKDRAAQARSREMASITAQQLIGECLDIAAARLDEPRRHTRVNRPRLERFLDQRHRAEDCAFTEAHPWQNDAVRSDETVPSEVQTASLQIAQLRRRQRSGKRIPREIVVAGQQRRARRDAGEVF